MMQDVKSLIGTTVYDNEHQRVGILQDIYVDDESNEPTWATVKTGLFGQETTFVPLKLAKREDDGLKVVVTKDQIKDAPRIEPDGVITQDEEMNLYRYYKEIVLRSREEQRASRHHDDDNEQQDNNPHEQSDSGEDEKQHSSENKQASGDDEQQEGSRVTVHTTRESHDNHDEQNGGLSKGQPVRRVRIRKYVVTEVIEPIGPHHDSQDSK